MKKFFLVTAVLLLAFFVKAQNYETIKNTLIIPTPKAFQKAKEDVDKGMANAKFTAKPEAYILKATVYAGLASDSTIRNTPESEKLIIEAEAAFAKYREMQPDLALLEDVIYRNAPIHIYSSLFSAGYKDYENKKWQEGLDKFKKVVDLSDMLIAKKIITVAADTNSLLLAGIIAENANQKDEAAKYYSRLADLKVSDKGYESIYSFLVRYYFTKNDLPNFEKYKAIGKDLYPNSEFFTYDKVDFAAGLEEDLNKKIKALEETIAADPGNHKAIYSLAGLIYDTLNSTKESAVQPANAAELETKMIAAFTKAAALKPEDPLPFYFIGENYINKAERVNDERTVHAAEMKKRTKPGTASSKEDIAKRDALDVKYADAMDMAREPYEKAAEVFAKKEKLSNQDKQMYKRIAGYLGDIYIAKKNKAKGKPADQAKFAAEEKKWNDLYDAISKM